MSVTLKVGGDNKEAIRIVEQLQKKVEQLEAQNRKLNQETKQGADTGVKGFQGMVESAGRAALAYVSVQGAISVVNQLLRDQIALQERAAQTQSTAADAQRAMIANLGVSDPSKRQEWIAGVERIAAQTGAPIGTVYGSAAIAASAKGALTGAEARDAMLVGARAFPRDQESQLAYTGALLDIAQLTGSGDALANMGLISTTTEMARVTTAKGIAANIVPGAAAVAQTGGNAQEALAFTATLSGPLSDATGAVTATVAKTIAMALEKELPVETQYETVKRNGREFSMPTKTGMGEMTPLQRLGFLRQDPSRAEEFLANNAFSLEALPVTRRLLDPADNLYAQMVANAGAFPETAQLRASGEAFIYGLGDTQLQTQAAKENVLNSATERGYLKDIASGNKALMARGLDEILTQHGYDYLDRSLTAAQFYGATALGTFTPDEFVEGNLTGRAKALRNRPHPSEAGLERADKLDQVVSELRGIRVNQRTADPDKHVEK